MDDKDQSVFREQTDLTEQQQDDFKYVKERIEQLKKTRNNHYGFNLDKIWADADRDYVPHRLRSQGPSIIGSEDDSMNVISTDEDRGWRGATIQMGQSNWQSDVSQSNPFIKIQVALSILIDQNPTGLFTATSKKFQATSELIKQLYQRSWQVAKSQPQLKLFAFNLAKYGWAVARTYPLKIEREVNKMTEYDPNNPDGATYEKKTVVEYNDVFRENLDPRNCWIDDMAKPNNPMSVRDWCWRKIYDMEELKREFGNSKLWDKVKKGGNVSELPASQKGTQKKFYGKDLVEVYFYESKVKDMFWVIAGGDKGTPVQMEHLPISDIQGAKKLSLWQTYWNLRHSESPYGIGIYEAIRYENAMLDRISNMTIDQLTLSIYKMFFYQGTSTLQDTGDITIVPGLGKQTLDPKNMTFLEVPGPGPESWQGIEVLKQRVDDASGVMEPLSGSSPISGKGAKGGKGKITAFQIAQEKEMALRRLKNPLDNILEALNEEGYLTISLFQLLYSIPEVHEITDERLINDYLEEVKNDPDLFSREDGKFQAKVFREFPLNLDTDHQGNLTETKDTQFFRVKPKFLDWEGIIRIKAESILTPSKQVDKAMNLEFYNMYIPLVMQLMQEIQAFSQSNAGQPVDLDEIPHGKIAKLLPKLYDKDPRDLLPNAWIGNATQSKPQQKPQTGLQQPLFVQNGKNPGQDPQNPPQGQNKAQTMIPRESPTMGQKIMQGIGNMFK